MRFINPGTGLSSQAVTHQVLSLLTVFTFVFGMGTGVFRSLRHQEAFVPSPALTGSGALSWAIRSCPENCILSDLRGLRVF